MANGKRHIHASLPPRTLIRPERSPAKLKPAGTLKSGKIWTAPKGYRSAGVVIVEDYQLIEDTVPESVHQRAELKGDVIIKLKSETIVKDGRMVSDRITAEFFVPEFLCC